MNNNPKQHQEEISQMIIEGVQEIIGSDETQLLLKQARVPFEMTSTNDIHLKKIISIKQIQRLKTIFINNFGENGTRGAALRVGRSFFEDFFKQYGIQTGLNSLEYRTLPLKKRIKTGLETLSNTLSGFSDFVIKVSDDENKWYWVYENSPCSLDLGGKDISFSDFSVGLLQAYLLWASGGKAFPVQQATIEKYYVIEIGKKALG